MTHHVRRDCQFDRMKMNANEDVIHLVGRREEISGFQHKLGVGQQYDVPYSAYLCNKYKSRLTVIARRASYAILPEGGTNRSLHNRVAAGWLAC